MSFHFQSDVHRTTQASSPPRLMHLGTDPHSNYQSSEGSPRMTDTIFWRLFCCKQILQIVYPDMNETAFS